MRNFLSLLASIGFIACSASGPSSTGGTDGGTEPTNDSGGSSSGAASLSLSSQMVSGVPVGGASGSYQYTAQVIITNVSVASPIPLLPMLFSVTTDGSRVVVPTMATGCASSDRLAVGGRAMCGLQFTLQAPQRPVTIRYDDGGGHTASAAAQPVDLTPSLHDVCVAAGTLGPVVRSA